MPTPTMQNENISGGATRSSSTSSGQYSPAALEWLAGGNAAPGSGSFQHSGGTNWGSGSNYDQSTRTFGYNPPNWLDGFTGQQPQSPGPGSGPGGGGGYGGGGGGAAAPDYQQMLGVLAGYQGPRQFAYDQQYTPTQLGALPQYQYQALDLPEYQGTGFYDFDSSQYDIARQGLQQGLAADRAAGMAAYGDARTELAQYQNPYAGRSFSQQQPLDAAMQRMLAANGMDAGVVGEDLARGVQADQAFGSVLDLLGRTAGQRQAAEMRALGGDERRFSESLANQGRNMNLGIDMALAQARSQYEKDRWAYGEAIAQQNYQTNVQQAIANNQGQNQANQMNTQTGIDRAMAEWMANNQAAQTNTQAANQAQMYNNQNANQWDQQKLQAVLDILASGAQGLDLASIGMG